MIKRIALVVALLLSTSLARAQQSLQAQVNAVVQQAQLGDAKLSLYITDLTTGQDIALIHPDLALMPASNMKLATTATALATLGADYVFSTQLRLDGSTL